MWACLSNRVYISSYSSGSISLRKIRLGMYILEVFPFHLKVKMSKLSDDNLVKSQVEYGDSSCEFTIFKVNIHPKLYPWYSRFI